jgi:hypothetical protein
MAKDPPPSEAKKSHLLQVLQLPEGAHEINGTDDQAEKEDNGAEQVLLR